MTCRSPSVHIRKGWPGAVSKSITSKRSFAAGKKGRKEKADGVKTETPFLDIRVTVTMMMPYLFE